MYKFLFFFLALASSYGQETKIESHQLSENEINTIFSAEIKNKYDIDFEIYRGYRYDDKAGSHLILMTENSIPKGSDTFRKTHLEVYNDSLKAYFFDLKNEFWTKFFELDDFDGDGIIDPILIYGTYGMNGSDDGRIKIIILQNNQKIAIRHQNGILDGERSSIVDATFYDLPEGIQKQVIKQMKAIMENESGIFPSGWEEAMAAKKLKLTE